MDNLCRSDNVIADFESRKTYIDAEWKLNSNIFSKAIEKLQFSPNTDCFATRINCQIDRYVSYKPGPYAFLINAFAFNWQPYNCYLFPPFSVIDQGLKKIQVDQAEALLVAPVLPTKPWFNTFQDLLIAKPYIVEPRPENLILPNHPEKKHPLWKKVEVNDWEIIRDKYLSVGYCPEAVNIIINSWRPSTKTAYNVYFKKWLSYAKEHDLNITSPSTRQALEFLTNLHKSSCSYNQISTARSKQKVSFTSNFYFWRTKMSDSPCY